MADTYQYHNPIPSQTHARRAPTRQIHDGLVGWYQTTRTVLSGTAMHCLRSLAPVILTCEFFWLVLLRRWRKGGDEPALGAFVEVRFVPQML